MKNKINHTNIPAIVLILVFILPLVIISCKKSNAPPAVVTVPPPQTDPLDTAITDTSFYMDITLNGQRTFGIINGAGNQYSWGAEGNILADTNAYVNNRVGIAFIPNTQAELPLFAFSKGSLVLYEILPHYQSVSTVNSFFAPGSYGYSTRTHDTTYDRIPGTTIVYSPPLTKTLLSDGINIYWLDNTGKEWQSCFGTADQTGSFFTITKTELGSQQEYPGFVASAYITANFDCNLYDTLGNKIHITNGKFRLPVIF